ncbi:MAG: hypothetical protein AABX23_03980 [Nanoarchaeota archaeon]
MASGDSPCVYRTGTHIIFFNAPDGKLMAGRPFSRFKESLLEGLGHATPAALADQRLCTALALFCARLHEHSPNARFLALMMALEVLTEQARKAPIALDMLKRWDAELRQLLECANTEEDREALLSLQREVVFRKEASIRSRVNALVAKAFQQPRSGKDVQRAVEIYDLRGALLHDGRVDADTLTKASADAERLVAVLLKHRLRAHGS